MGPQHFCRTVHSAMSQFIAITIVKMALIPAFAIETTCDTAIAVCKGTLRVCSHWANAKETSLTDCCVAIHTKRRQRKNSHSRRFNLVWIGPKASFTLVSTMFLFLFSSWHNSWQLCRRYSLYFTTTYFTTTFHYYISLLLFYHHLALNSIFSWLVMRPSVLETVR